MEQKKVLVIDDDAAILDSLKLILEFDGYEVQTMCKGAAVFELASEQLPHVILLDMWLSGEDGRDICRAIKSDGNIKHLPVIMISANQGLEQSARDAGADAFIAKPFNITDVLDAVKKMA